MKITTGVVLGFSSLGFNASLGVEASEQGKQSADDYISSLDYDNREILAHNGELVENVLPTSSYRKNGSFIVLQREKKQLSNGSADISVINSTSNKVFPGALLKADSGLLENKPTIISGKRAPLTLSVDLPGMKDGDNQIKVENPKESTVQSSVNNLLSTWNEKYAGDYPNVAARIEYSDSMAYSMEQLKAKFGLSFEKLKVPLNLDFSTVTSGEKQVQIVNFKQIYYTVNMDTPENPGDVFDSSITTDYLVKKGVNSQTPPVYVSNVAYGRSMYVKLETSSKSNEVQNAFAAAIKGVDISQNTEYQSILNNSSFTAVILGGDAGQASKVVSGKIEDLKEIIQEGSRYGKLNPSVPISYTTSFLKDNSAATISNQTEYVETKINEYKDGAVTLDHSGAYVIKYHLYWDELSYDEEGNEVLTPRSWERNDDNLTAHFATTIQLKGNVRNLRIKAEECTGLAWEWWRTIYDKSDIPLVKHRIISNWGTTLSPKVSDEVTD
ncbi:alveolysin [Vagococcus coleopterorum]|uniref:Thiol-activated cytolysin n=2 Tax=Vagococcus coleopterorum TaxID=2714946 RepID=A0A6G8AQ08_9ENTE|nr:alveolysin [Vagococcus coleopterorum]